MSARFAALLRGIGSVFDVSPEPRAYRRIILRSHRRDMVGDSFKATGSALNVGVEQERRGEQGRAPRAA